MSTYNEIKQANLNSTLIEYSLFDSEILDEWSDCADVTINFQDMNIFAKFNTEFYVPFMNYLTSFTNIFQLLTVLEECYGDETAVQTYKNKIVKLVKKGLSMYKLYSELFELIQADINEEILFAMSYYAQDDVDFDNLKEKDGVSVNESDDIVLEIKSTNLDILINKIKTREGLDKLCNLAFIKK